MSDQVLKNDILKALEVGLELAIDELLDCETNVISALMICGPRRRSALRQGHDITPLIDQALFNNAGVIQARDRVKRLAMAVGTLQQAKWHVTDPSLTSDEKFCGDHGGALSTPRDECSVCQFDACCDSRETGRSGE